MAYTDLLFVFGFLPLYAAASFLCADARRKNIVSLVFSAVFILWGRPIYYALIIAALFAVYAAGLLIRKNKLFWLKSAATAAAAAAVIPLAADACSNNGIGGAVSAFGMLLFLLRSALYLKEADEYAETDIITLAVYLMSFEFMAVSPVYSYRDMKDIIKSRRAGLAMLSGGIERFAAGLAAVTVLGYSLERIRTSALFAENVPYINAAAGALAAVVLVYVSVIGYSSMSEGLMLISGYRIPLSEGCFMPKSLVNSHINSLYPSLAESLEKLLNGAGSVGLAVSAAVSCIISGLALGFNAAAVAFAGIVLTAVLMQKLFEAEKSVLSGVFTCLSLAAGFIILAAGSPEGLVSWFGALNVNKYPFDIGFYLYEELGRSAVWALIAVLYISPLRPFWGRTKRGLMAENEKLYGAMRVLSVAAASALLIVSAVAMVSAV